jgi:hypothetical protein
MLECYLAMVFEVVQVTESVDNSGTWANSLYFLKQCTFISGVWLKFISRHFTSNIQLCMSLHNNMNFSCK